MATFAVIDTTSGGDQFYEGMVKDAANWAILEAGLYALYSHTHGAGGAPALSIIAAEANLTAGLTDGEQVICSVTGNVYMWEAGSAKWQPREGNQYATSGLPTTAYNILTGTRVYDTTVARMKYWNGTAFVVDDFELRKSFVL